jgi:hypothetical protein
MIMFFQNLLKATPLIVLTLLNLNALHANAGGVSGGGGDASESQFGEIRNDLLRWIQEGGAHELQLPTHVSHEHYRTAMERVLAPHAVIVSFVTTAQESDPANRNPELRVTVDSQPKTCRGFISTVDSRPHILCNIERFANTQPAEQYRLVHHEFAGLAGVEQNIGASSDYQISSQLSEFLVPEVVLRLAVRRNQARGTRQIILENEQLSQTSCVARGSYSDGTRFTCRINYTLAYTPSTRDTWQFNTVIGGFTCILDDSNIVQFRGRLDQVYEAPYSVAVYQGSREVVPNRTDHALIIRSSRPNPNGSPELFIAQPKFATFGWDAQRRSYGSQLRVLYQNGNGRYQWLESSCENFDVN